MSNNDIYTYDESQSDRLARKTKESPFLVAGLVGLVGACAYGAYRFKHKGTMSTSVFLMQLRVAAQGTVVIALTAGLVYNMGKELLNKQDKK